jgi:hypothetical protein
VAYRPYVLMADGPLVVAASATFSFQAPTVTGFATADAATPLITQAGCSVTVTGTRFGLIATSPLVWVDGAECANVTQVSDTELTCDAPMGTGTLLNMTVGVQGMGSNAYNVSYVPPTVGALTPNWTFRYPTYNRTYIEIGGTDLGAGAQYLKEITIAGVRCPSITWLSATAVACHQVPSAEWNASAPAAVVKIGKFAAVSGGKLDILPQPVITSSAPTMDQPGSLMVLAGRNLLGAPYSYVEEVGLCPTAWARSWARPSAATPARCLTG